MVTNLAPFPYRITPMANIGAFTYADGATYLSVLEEMRAWLNGTLLPAVNTGNDGVTAQYQAGIDNAEATVTAAKTEWDTRFAAFMADLETEITALNDAAVAGMVTNPVTATGTAIRALLNSEVTADKILTLIGSSIYTRTQADAAFAGKDSTATALADLDGKVSAAGARAVAAATATGTEITILPDRVTGKRGTRLNLPTHVAGNTTGEATHPSVAYRPEGWNGYPYWMAFTPYQGADDSMEDPNIVVSRDGITWTVPPGVTNPLDDAPGSPLLYNSDTDAVFGPDNKLYVFWRTFDPNAVGAEETLWYRSSADGVTWAPKVMVAQANQATTRFISPSFVYEDGAWTCWYLNMLTTPFRIVRMRSTGSEPTAWGAPTFVSYTQGSQQAAYMVNRSPWHLKVIKAYGRYHMLVSDYSTDDATPARDLIYLNSPDGLVWDSAIGPCIPRIKDGEHDMMYRATLIPAVERGVHGFRVWYGAFLSTANPNVWAIYRTFISDGPHVERGSFVDNVTGATDAATPSYKARQITFDRFFKYTPDVQVSCSTGFVGTAAYPISTTGFQFNIDNPVQASRNGLTFWWTATEPE